jgi:hypothetical protein
MTQSSEIAVPQAPAPAVEAPAADPGRYPDFFIVGHAKCGTTALYEMLRRHPQIFMPEDKEPQYFARGRPIVTPANAEAFSRTGWRERTLAGYLSLFAPAGDDQLVGEASTYYLCSAEAPRSIAEVRPDARIIALLREPASFLRSLHLQMVRYRLETERDLRRALALEPERREGRQIPREAFWPQALQYTARVRYTEQLRRWHGVFGADNVLVLIYDDFRRDNVATARRVLRFLDVDDLVPMEPVAANPTARVRSLRMDRAVRAVYQGRGPLGGSARAATMLLPGPVRAAGLRSVRRHLVFGKPEPPDADLMLRLRRRFHGEVVAISEYLGRDLVTEWGYDRLG